MQEADRKGQRLDMIRNLRLLVKEEGILQGCYALGGNVQEMQAAVAAVLKKQEDGSWILTGPDGTGLQDWRVTAIFAKHGLLRWKE